MACIQRFVPDETARAARAIADDGCVILEQALPIEPLAALRRRMDRDTVDLLRYCATVGGNPRQPGHLQQGPPPFADYVYPEVAMNPHVNAVAQALFGGRPQLTFYNGNTNCPGSVRQHLHMDGRHHTAPGEPAGPTMAVVVNIPPGGMDDDNGAIELWPGSHRVAVHGEGQAGVPADMEAERLAEREPENPCTAPGDVLIRDVRLWHRGVPNASSRPRHMIALILSAPTDERSGRRLRFGRGCEGALEGQGADSNAEYVHGPIDYLYGPTKRIQQAQRRTQA